MKYKYIREWTNDSSYCEYVSRDGRRLVITEPSDDDPWGESDKLIAKIPDAIANSIKQWEVQLENETGLNVLSCRYAQAWDRNEQESEAGDIWLGVEVQTRLGRWNGFPTEAVSDCLIRTAFLYRGGRIVRTNFYKTREGKVGW